MLKKNSSNDVRRMKTIFSMFLVCTILFSISASAAIPISNTPIVVSRTVDLDKVESLNNELSRINAEIRSITHSSDFDLSHLQELEADREELISQLEDVGALASTEMLATLPTDTDNEVNIHAASTLPDNLADLEEMYSPWFLFEGYEETIYSGGQYYRAYIVTIKNRDAENSLLMTNSGSTITMISKTEAIGLGSMNALLSSGFDVVADLIYGALDTNIVKQCILSAVFPIVYNTIDRYSVTVNLPADVYMYFATLESQISYAYVWDDNSDSWVYCASTSRLYVDETHTLYTTEYVGGQGSQYQNRIHTTYDDFVVRGYPLVDLGTAATNLYIFNGEQAPNQAPAYQVGDITLYRKLGSSNVGEPFVTINAVTCARPGDLWTLGHPVS